MQEKMGNIINPLVRPFTNKLLLHIRMSSLAIHSRNYALSNTCPFPTPSITSAPPSLHLLLGTSTTHILLPGYCLDTNDDHDGTNCMHKGMILAIDHRKFH